jgi:hypothetical protein
MSIGSSSWGSIESQIIDRVVAGIHKHFAETDVTVQILTAIGTLEAFEEVVEASSFAQGLQDLLGLQFTTAICMNCKVCNINLEVISHPCGS